MKRWTYAVCFERPDTQPPETIRGEVEAGSVGRACAKAVREASGRRTGRGYEDVVVLITKGRVLGEVE